MSTATLTITGHTGHDARHFEDSGRTLFRLAHNTTFRNREGVMVEQVTWYQVVVWGNGAERLAGQVGKGSRLVVTGRLRLVPMTRNEKSGEVYYRAVIDTQASGVEFVNLKTPAGPAEEEAPVPMPEIDAVPVDDDEIPF